MKEYGPYLNRHRRSYVSECVGRLGARQQRGQSLTEMLIVLPMLALLIFGILEMALMFQARSTLSAATFEAARAGSLHNALKSDMRSALARGLSPLFVRERSLTALTTARIQVEAMLRLPAAPRGRIDIISPSRQVFNQFKTKRYVGDANNERLKEVIPNDNLMWRVSTKRTISSPAGDLSVNVQDANLLKVRAVWCHKLIVPFLDRFLHWTWTIDNPGWFSGLPNAEQLRCDAYSEISGGGYYIPMTTYAIVRMQSHVLPNDLP